MDTKTKSTKSKSKPKAQPVGAWVNAENKKLPDRGENGFYSLSLLLEHYSPGVLATLIEQHGIFTQDRYGRQIHCKKTENAEQYEKALDLVAHWQSELEDPGPENSWNTPNYHAELHPTENWWLPDNLVTTLSNTAAVEKIEDKAQVYWTKRSLDEFEQEIRRAGSIAAAAKRHGCSRQRYSDVYGKKRREKNESDGEKLAQGVAQWGGNPAAYKE